MNNYNIFQRIVASILYFIENAACELRNRVLGIKPLSEEEVEKLFEEWAGKSYRTTLVSFEDWSQTDFFDLIDEEDEDDEA
ncbi:hypothetical protein D6833_02930 [Candidatus Parcubacteria bacterium]|nr:MAG: hypothetical protein D6833_02930 [Candidatus Parcubacteria bacterium]